jgi:type II secretory pathway pseudopilin PulG
VKQFNALRRSKCRWQTAAEPLRQEVRRKLARRKIARRKEEGYILLTLLLVVALMGIFAMAAISKIDFEIRRDRELEMVHRGVQYSRAIRAYYKKFGRYPTRLEDLDNTNNLRYLRKHYKDPLNKNKDFRLLHFGEQGVTLSGSIGGASPIGSPAGLNSSGIGPGVGSSGSMPGLGGSGFGNAGVNSSGVFAQSSGPGSNSRSGLAGNSDSTAGQSGTTPAAGTDPTQASTQVAAGAEKGDDKADSSSGGQQLIASGPIVGVASISKKDTIREYNKKKKYNEWQFVYDPAFDRGGLITTPYQPSLAMAQTNLQPGATGSTTGQSPFGQPASGQSSFGQSSFGQSSFGQSSFGQSGSGNNSNTSGTTPPAQPATTTPQ